MSFSIKWGFPNSPAGKESACNTGDPSSIPGLGRSPGEAIGYPLHYSWASLVAQMVKNPPAIRKTGFNPWFGKIPQQRERLLTPVFWPEEFYGLYIIKYEKYFILSIKYEKVNFLHSGPSLSILLSPYSILKKLTQIYFDLTKRKRLSDWIFIVHDNYFKNC